VTELKKSEDLKLKISEEGHAYTPGLKVKKSIIIQKFRNLPIKGKVLVKENDKVDFQTKVAEVMMPGEPVVINAAAKLGIPPEDLEKNMVKHINDKVTKGENVCGFNSFFGLWKNWIQSPIDGFVESVSSISGQLILREAPRLVNIDAYIPGKVVKIIEEEGAVIETKGAFIQGIFGLGGEKHGEIKIVVDNPSEKLTENKITPDCKDKIIVGGSLVTLEALKKAVEIGVSGIVTGGVKDVDIESILGYEIGVAITGQEELGFSLIITEGFGEMPMNPRTLELLKEFNGVKAAINGATQIRAGVQRPEIIIPNEKYDVEEAENEFLGGMKVGTPIRIIREPYFGVLGKIASLPVELQTLESETSVRIVEIELEDGKKAIIPRANIEIIEV
jgi:hypothetical protein